MAPKKPVVRSQDLPVDDCVMGDRRLVLSEKKIYEWNGSEWILVVTLNLDYFPRKI